MAKWLDFISKIFHGREDDDPVEFTMGLSEGDDAESIQEVLSHQSLRRADLNIYDYRDRERYIRACCEQMTASSKEVETQKIEYQTVTEHLTDLEEISALPVSDREEMKKRARKIIQIEEDEADYRRPASKITETQYREMEQMADEIPDVLKLMREREEYQMAVRRDMNLLEGEKGALAYQKREDRHRAHNMKGYAIIILVTGILAAVMLVFLEKAVHYDVAIGYYIIAGVVAMALTACVMGYRNAQLSETKTERQLNRAITLQNSAKIKYVNVTNVLDYTYSKYNIHNSYELSYMWDKYKEEKEARNHSEEVAIQLENARKSLFALLKHNRVKDPTIWVYQPGTLVFEEEMTEMRHSLIIQRQKLRKGIDFNMYNLEASKKEIEDLVKEYPKYAKEILAIVTQYE